MLECVDMGRCYISQVSLELVQEEIGIGPSVVMPNLSSCLLSYLDLPPFFALLRAFIISDLTKYLFEICDCRNITTSYDKRFVLDHVSHYPRQQFVKQLNADVRPTQPIQSCISGKCSRVDRCKGLPSV